MPAVIIYESCVRYEPERFRSHTVRRTECSTGKRAYCTALWQMNSNATLKIQENFRKRTVNGTRKLSGLVRNQTGYVLQDIYRVYNSPGSFCGADWESAQTQEVPAVQELSILILQRKIKIFYREFDPGSGWTLAACLTHASRTGMPFLKRAACCEWKCWHLSGGRVSNAWGTCPVQGDNT